MSHLGTLVSGEITCTCGWTSGHSAMASESVDAFQLHQWEHGVRPATFVGMLQALVSLGYTWLSTEEIQIDLANLAERITPELDAVILALINEKGPLR